MWASGRPHMPARTALSTSPVGSSAPVGACTVLASVMTTLYIRDVSEEVAMTLKERAAAEGKSLSAYVAAELTKIAARPTNAQIAATLRGRDRSAGPTSDEIVETVQTARR